MKGIRLVPLADAHIGPILEIEIASNGSPWSEKSFRNELDNPQSEFLVAVSGTTPVGFGGVWICIDEAHITNLAVAASRRGEGIGKGLVKELLGRAADRGATCATLEVRAGNEPAIALYRSLGFDVVSVRKRYYPDNREDALIMWRYQLET